MIGILSLTLILLVLPPKLILDCPVAFCMLFLLAVDGLILNFPQNYVDVSPHKYFHLH